jgi:hypothetical protein
MMRSNILLILSAFTIGSNRSFTSGAAIAKRACFGAGNTNNLGKSFCKFYGTGCFWGTEKFFKSDFGVKFFQGSGKILSG